MAAIGSTMAVGDAAPDKPFSAASGALLVIRLACSD
jgi:hypothetical protein